MRENWRRTTGELWAAARAYQASVQSATARAWGRVSVDRRKTLGHHAVAVATVAAVTVLTLASGLGTAGPMLLADVVIAFAAWFGGLSVGAAAALAAVLVARVAAVPLTGTAIGFWMALLLCSKGLIVATVLAALSARARADADQLSELEQWVERLQADARKRNSELAEMEVSSAEAHAKLRNEADVARRQLTTLQSVTDPALDTLDGAALVTSLLERVRIALGADGVALRHFDALGGRIFVAGSGLQPLGKGKGRLPNDCQNGRSVLIHNDAGRVADTSLCQWPADVTSLIAVPVVHAGRLQLVVEVANQKARRSTEWELALILVVAERAAGLLRQDANARTGALA
jgi:hypothetical protein